MSYAQFNASQSGEDCITLALLSQCRVFFSKWGRSTKQQLIWLIAASFSTLYFTLRFLTHLVRLKSAKTEQI